MRKSLARRISFTAALAVVFLTMSQSGNAHEQHHAEMMKSESHGTEDEGALMFSINELYLNEVKPIFKRSCFDCHSSSTTYPWYSQIPGVKQIIASDVKEARRHLDFTNDFPFSGHGNPADDLRAINDEVQKGDMPPLRYRILHSTSKLNDDEKAAVKAWIEKSLTILKVEKTTRR